MLQATGSAASRCCAVLIAFATCSQASALRLEPTTLAPCSARRRTMASPIPLVEPVTRATFPARLNSSISASLGKAHRKGIVSGAAGVSKILGAGGLSMKTQLAGLAARALVGCAAQPVYQAPPAR